MRPDPNGDVLLQFKDQSNDTLVTFSVSSKVLYPASPVSQGIFGPQFKEGQQLLKG